MTSFKPWHQFAGFVGWSCIIFLLWVGINSIVLLIESFLYSKIFFICKEDFFVTLFHTTGILIFSPNYLNAMVRHCPVLFVTWKPQVLYDNGMHGSRHNIHFPSYDFLFLVNSWVNSINNLWHTNHTSPDGSFMITYSSISKNNLTAWYTKTCVIFNGFSK
jgi:hypothetical protein